MYNIATTTTTNNNNSYYMKSSDAEASKCSLKFSSKMSIL